MNAITELMLLKVLMLIRQVDLRSVLFVTICSLYAKDLSLKQLPVTAVMMY